MRLSPCLLLALAIVPASGCVRAIQRGLTEPAADGVVVALDHEGIAAELEVEEVQGQGPATFRVLVPSAEGARALAILTAEGLPHDPPKGYADVYGQGSLVPSAMEERARYEQALAGEIEATLLRLDGVIDARVHLVLQPDDELHSAQILGGIAPPRATASVLLKLAPTATAAPTTDIARLVAGGVPGLAPADVVVVTTTSAPPERARRPLSHVGPLWVAAGSRAPLVATLAILLLLITVLAVAVVLLARRSHDRPTAEPATPPGG